MAEKEIQGRSFGQRRPPLTELISSILVRYPDGGQILKELIQNADDAGATEVKFLHDSQSFGTESLASPELSKFQGPALYCYNNAMFQDEDWEGIQNLMRSNKKEDPLKVGRFGIGFNSVYHITDLPGIASGETVGFLDPHETFFERGVPGQRYDIKDGLLRPRLRNQFAPFHGVFGCDLSNTGSYAGTLFRFPLRNTPSKLSSKLYTASMIENLLGSLREEASVILLFLKNVQSISIYKRESDGTMICAFTVEISQDTQVEVTRQRQKLLLQANQPSCIEESKCIIGIRITVASENRKLRWLVVNQVGSTEKRIIELRSKLNLLPWIGLAIPIDSSSVVSGRIFCFLPLPPDVDCQTGLPTHVHGYFGLTDNRRGLTWPGAECQNNETAEWNKLLLTKIGSSVYSKMLEALVTNEPNANISQEEQRRLVYRTLPVLENVRGHWQSILGPLFQKLINQRVFYARQISRNTWITLTEGILDLQETGARSETRKAVLSVLLAMAKTVITDLPPHVMKIIKKYFSPRQVISPQLLRSVLKNSDIHTASREDKFRLLEYVLSDGQTSDISGVPLLPLANGHMTTFHPNKHVSHPNISVFVPSGRCTAKLLPNLSGRFLDESLPEPSKSKLYAMAATEIKTEHTTQLVRLTDTIVCENLPNSLPVEWFGRSNTRDKVSWEPEVLNHPSQEWLEAIWNWINASFPSSLEKFQGIPLIPLQNFLGVLSQNSKFIFACNGSWNVLPLPISKLLTACGCTVLSNIPRFLRHQDIKVYIAPPTPAGVLTVLSRVSSDIVQTRAMQILTASSRADFREFMRHLPDTTSNSLKNVLLQLPVFDTLDGCCTAAKPRNGELLKAASQEFILPAGFQLSKGRVLISCMDDGTRKLLQLLNVEVLKPAEVLVQYLLPDISANTCYTSQQVDQIMLWILERMVIFRGQSQTFLEHLKALRFVPAQKGKRKQPTEMYDPKDALLCCILAGEDVFPVGDFALDDAISKLKQLGLRTRTMLTAADLYRFAQIISSSPVCDASVKKAKALVEILNNNPSYLNQQLTRRSTLKAELCLVSWIPCAPKPPENYPGLMLWYNKSAFFSSSEICTASKALLIGSSMPTLGVKMNVHLQQEFNMKREPPIAHVMNQLKAAVTSWKHNEGETTSTMEIAKFQEMLTKIYFYLSSFPFEAVRSALEKVSVRDWVWHGRGFCRPTNVALLKDFALDLRPRLFLLQNEFRANSVLTTFFLQHGVRKKFSEEDILGVLHDIQKKHSNPKEDISSEVEQDLELCCAILQWVVKDGKVLAESLQERVYVPVQSSSNVLVLKSCKNCTYCDRDWLRQGGTELDIPGDFQIIHDSISGKIARLLGVPPLSTCLLSAKTLGFKQMGPYESITNRIKTILQEYKEGVGIFKELIQNADDAGATEVRFLVDWRNGPEEKLLSPKMTECQGPALWAYNNAVFTDEDFENINKLAGGTKVEAFGKIGRFGLGFNAVYHITDIPSFVSRQYFVVFDPNVNHLQSHIRDKSRPGICIDLADNPRPLSAFDDQFQPYHNVFGCCTQLAEGERFHCNGTLFRFPFRTDNEASESKIWKTVYNEKKVKQVVNSLRESSSLLLLYTQHVKKVELYEVNNGRDPSQMQLVLSVSKNVPKLVRQCNTSSDKLPFIEDCSKWWQRELWCETGLAGPSRCEIVKITTKEMASDLIKNKKQSVRKEAWLVSSGVGTDSSVSLASGEGRKHGLLPCAAAAARLSYDSSNDPHNQQDTAIESISGEAFCFLPLSIPTGLPVHVNAYFAITSNRRGIWERTTSRQQIEQQIEVRWNESLMEDALTNTYVELLHDLKRLTEGGQLRQYTFYDLWPISDELHSRTWERLVKSLYSRLVTKPLSLWRSTEKWLAFNHGYILDHELRLIPEVVVTLKILNKNVFEVPLEVVSSLVKSGQDDAVRKRTLDFMTFLKSFFLPSVKNIPKQIRDTIVCHVLDYILRGREEFVPLFNEYPCITCSKDGYQLAKPTQLFNPFGPVASLFSPEDYRFPVGEHFLTKHRLHALEQLGMVKDQMSWREVCGRAESVQKIAASSHQAGRERARNLIKYLKEHMDKLPKTDNEILAILRQTEFLPFLFRPPDGYHLPWKGSEFSGEQFFSPNDVFLSSEKHLVGSSSPILDDSENTGCSKLDTKVKELLGFFERVPKVEQVLEQLDAAIKSRVEGDNRQTLTKDTLTSVCKRVYKYCNNLITRAYPGSETYQNRQNKGQETAIADWMLVRLSQRPWIFIQGHFVTSKQVAYCWSGNGAPYLYGLPYEYNGRYDNLFRMSGVRDVFHVKDFLDALCALKDSKKESPLTNEELKLAVCFLSELKEKDALTTHIGHIPLPDTLKLLSPSKELTVNMSLWLKDRGDARYVHEDIPPQLALDLGAKSLQNRRLKKYSNALGIPFGQSEKLTVRLKNILKSYPCDSGILKELIQNADDAGATEIHFIHDTRKLPCKSVIQNNAEEVQGPALCVYNNRPFTEQDLEGIQHLGVGSKGNDPEKTGQYGIGFNAVYHLTDCPSFLSNEDTLCFLDPHCRYAPEATPDSPGELFKPIDEEFKEDFKDVLLGFLGEHFTLKDATMFRLPLRTRERAQESLISGTWAENYVRKLLKTFASEAKKMLLFLNHIKKVSLSEIDEHGILKRVYEVAAVLEDKNEEQRRTLWQLMKEYKDLPTCKVPWNEITYPMTVSDSNEIMEKWLVHQCCGTKFPGETDTPEGHLFRLFPRGGVAALMSKAEPRRLFPQEEPQHVAYCFLPLPVYTGLPVHVNGHFALDSSRRNLWQDTDPTSPLTRWNNFLKSRVLAPGYATLICEARKYIPHREANPTGNLMFAFASIMDAKSGLKWYHRLFPHPSEDSLWNGLSNEVYRILGTTRAAILPVLVEDKAQQVTVTAAQGQHGSTKNIPQRIRSWCPVQDVYFYENKEPNRESSRLSGILLRMHLPLLLHSPLKIYSCFEKAEVSSSLLTPKSVIDFLQTFQSPNSTCKIGQLPCQLEATSVKSILDLKILIDYCKKEENFSNFLEGLPLLLTADGQLRVFDTSYQVFCSIFSDLFPARTHLFVHPDFVYELPVMDDPTVSQVMRRFTVNMLAEYFPDVFISSIRGAVDHLSWTFRENGPLSKRWFQRLWDFLEKNAGPECGEYQVSLKILGEWPIIPTTHGKLVTVDNGKTVLDATPRQAESAQGRYVRQVLGKMNCPSLDTDITLKKPVYRGTSPFAFLPSRFLPENSQTVSQSPDLDGRKVHVTDPYVAHPHSAADVLDVLDYMSRKNILNTSQMTASDFRKMLAFFQDDLTNLQSKGKFIAILRALPFYLAIDGNHFSLASFTFCAVIPRGVPTVEIAKLQLKTACVFLHPDPTADLSQLYKVLGVGVERSVSEFYTKYIIPSFKIFTRESQIVYLTHIRDTVLQVSLAGKAQKQEREAFLQFLTGSPCVPDHGGKLHHANEFHDPRNEVFQIMLGDNPNQFPPHPFQESEWVEFLSEIGLKTHVQENQFLEFCKEVASVASRCREDKSNAEKSKVLVRYLFLGEHLRSEDFLCSVSSVRFIASEKVQPILHSLHKQYQCNTDEDQPPYVQFLDAVPWKFEVLTWTSAELLPSWCLPYDDLVQYLGIQEIPSVHSVTTHLQNISCTLAELSKKDEALPQPGLLKKIMVSVYTFLDKEKDCTNKEVSDGCSQDCIKIGNRLLNIPCVLVDDGKVLVRGNQLSFSLQKGHSYQPFLYAVPREYGSYEHVMKRIGATEQLTSLQLANVLKAIKNQCQDSKLNPNFAEKARAATGQLLQCVKRESSCGKEASSISDLNELFLPSEDGFLVSSNKLICKIPPSLNHTLAKREFCPLLPIEKCGLRREEEDDYLNSLPPRLRPAPLNTLFKEVLDPSCINDTCPLCQKSLLCEFIERYVLILQCDEFREGLVRLLKHQRKSNELSEKEKEKSSVFGSKKLEVKCMRKIIVHLVSLETEKPLENSSRERSCYVVERNGLWTFYIQHDHSGRSNVPVLQSFCIDRILGRCLIGERSLLAVASMLMCESPVQIPGVLDNLDIEKDFSEDEVKLGREVPFVFHQLLQQNPLFVFHEGEVVAFGMSTANETGDNENLTDASCEEQTTMKYVLAKVISWTDKENKDVETYDFTAQYLIDLGYESKVVSVLDLYKFYQNEFLENLARDIVLYSGDSSKKPDNLDEAKREILEALQAAWRLPRHLRRKVIRRLFLRWHPDKNPDNVEFSSEVMKFLMIEVKRMETEERGASDDFGFSELFRGWGRQARRDRETFQNFRRCRGTCTFGRSFAGASDYTSPNPSESRRWMRQAFHDLEVAEYLLSASQTFFAWVCFVSHQSVEKALKAALYAKCGLDNDQLHTHDLYKLANEVCRLRNAPTKITDLAIVVGNYYLPTRYPNRQPGSIIPADAFDREQSQEAVEATKSLLEIVNAFIAE